MFSVRLSSVMTGCGGNDTTRSRRSIRARMRSMKGTSRVSCPLTVRLYRPNRSITAASACGISATDLATTTMANITRTTSSTNPATAPCTGVPFSRSVFRSVFADRLAVSEYHRRGAVDVHDGDRIARFVDVVVVVGARRPDLAVELHLARVAGNPIKHHCAFALQGLDSCRQPPGRRQPLP